MNKVSPSVAPAVAMSDSRPIGMRLKQPDIAGRDDVISFQYHYSQFSLVDWVIRKYTGSPAAAHQFQQIVAPNSEKRQLLNIGAA